MRVTCGSECCFWLRRFFRVSAIPPRMCLGSCIPYTCLFINYPPFDDKQLEIVSRVNELMNHSVVISLPDCTQHQVSCCYLAQRLQFQTLVCFLLLRCTYYLTAKFWNDRYYFLTFWFSEAQ